MMSTDCRPIAIHHPCGNVVGSIRTLLWLLSIGAIIGDTINVGRRPPTANIAFGSGLIPIPTASAFDTDSTVNVHHSETTRNDGATPLGFDDGSSSNHNQQQQLLTVSYRTVSIEESLIPRCRRILGRMCRNCKRGFKRSAKRCASMGGCERRFGRCISAKKRRFRALCLEVRDRLNWERHFDCALSERDRQVFLQARGAGADGDGTDAASAADIGTTSNALPNNDVCINGGGVVSTATCCIGQKFPSTCGLGACGCATNYSEPTLMCNCPTGQCWNGDACVVDPATTTAPTMIPSASPSSSPTAQADRCTNSSGEVGTTDCCGFIRDYPNLCIGQRFGICGNSRVCTDAGQFSETIVCNCPVGKCFDGNTCVESTPTDHPSSRPSHPPTNSPSTTPSTFPSIWPSTMPNSKPSSRPSNLPTAGPSATPSTSPSIRPSTMPSSKPSISIAPTPANEPSSTPTLSSKPSTGPTPIATSIPSSAPSHVPSLAPSMLPTKNPSSSPSISSAPTSARRPSSSPSQSVRPSSEPTETPSTNPSLQPSTSPSAMPSSSPSISPSDVPSLNPSAHPSDNPSRSPSTSPSSGPSKEPSLKPSTSPSQMPSTRPSLRPSKSPSANPSASPSLLPSSKPSVGPSESPTPMHSDAPSRNPSVSPSNSPTECKVLEESCVDGDVCCPHPSGLTTTINCSLTENIGDRDDQHCCTPDGNACVIDDSLGLAHNGCCDSKCSNETTGVFRCCVEQGDECDTRFNVCCTGSCNVTSSGSTTGVCVP